MTCENCRQRTATTVASKKKEPLVGGLDARTGVAQAVSFLCDECAKDWPPEAKRPLR